MAITKEEIESSLKNVGNNVQFKLRKVRLRFGSPWKYIPRSNDENVVSDLKKIQCTVMLDKTEDADQVKLVKAAMRKAMLLKWPDGKTKPRAQDRALTDGMEKDDLEDDVEGDNEEADGAEATYHERYPGTDNQYLLRLNQYPKSESAPNPIQILGPRKTVNPATGKKEWVQLTEESGSDMIYEGCYVNVVGRMYGQDGDTAKKFPNRIGCSLEIIQFAGHGEPFVSGEKADADELMDEEDVDDSDDFDAGDADVDEDDGF